MEEKMVWFYTEGKTHIFWDMKKWIFFNRDSNPQPDNFAGLTYIT